MGKVKRAKDGEVNGQGWEKEGKGCPGPMWGKPANKILLEAKSDRTKQIKNNDSSNYTEWAQKWGHL